MHRTLTKWMLLFLSLIVLSTFIRIIFLEYPTHQSDSLKIQVSQSRNKPRMIKRGVDLFGAVIGFLLLSPFMLLIAVMIYFHLGKPVLFRQQRLGLHGKSFVVYKFRTMHNSQDAKGNLLLDEKRLTRLGQFLRSTSLDELPELFNVLRGDMSLVGPRPLLPQYLTRYTREQARRHEVKPGITGWAQIHGRNSLSWEERFKLDVWYVDHQSFWLDLKILVQTVEKVLRREGISQDGQATMSEFMGTKS